MRMSIIKQELQKADKDKLHTKKILLMGRIEHVKEMVNWLQKQGIVVEAILDNDDKKQGLSVDGIPILAPERVLLPFREDVFILIYSPKYWEDMCGQFLLYGYQEGKHIYVLDRPGYEKNIGLVKKGLQLYCELQTQYGKNVQVFLVNCPLGDYYLLALYLYQYCLQNHIENYVLAGESEGIRKLSPMFHIKQTKIMTTEECNALIRTWIFLGEKTVAIKPLTIWQGAFRFNPCQVRQKDNFSFLDTFTKMIYSLDKPIPCYPNWKGNRKLVEAVFTQNNLPLNKTVIFALFSYSLQSLPAKFWIRLADLLKERGYSIAVNAGEEREHNFIKDSVTLRMNFSEVMIAMEMAGTVIGMRSGFFDITSQAKCRRIVLYPPSITKNVEWNSTDIGFCSLKRMGLCEDASEWEVNDPEEICIKILEVLSND